MPPILNKRTITWLLSITVIGVALLLLSTTFKKENTLPVAKEPEVKQEVSPQPKIQLIGKSFEGRDIEAYTYGDGLTHLVFVGGIHGGYEWNTVLLAYGIIDYLNAHLERIPKNITISILPSVNPDAIFKVTGKEGRFSVEDVTPDKKILTSARFNARDVDLNRNFDCKWQTKSTWQTKTVSAGTAVFSEPETKIIKDFLLKSVPAAVIFWHSKSNGVYASQCEQGILSGTRDLMNTYAQASGYPAIDSFDAYVVTGAAEDWLASIGIPAITVELKTHEGMDLGKNIAGTQAVIERYTK